MANRAEARSRSRRRNAGSDATAEGSTAARVAGQTTPASEAADPAGSPDRPGVPTLTRRDGARRAEQLAILSLAIVVALIGFAFHPLWIVAVGLMVLLWGFMASALRSGGASGSVLTEVVTAVVAEAKDMTDAASGGAQTDSDDRAPIDPSDPVGNASSDPPAHDRVAAAEPGSRPEGNDTDPDEVEPTKKELYAEAREAGIEGRSTMSKDELKKALDE
jgi:hypothetical protein